MAPDPTLADAPATPWLEDRYLDAITLYREVADAGSKGYPRGHLAAGERWTDALDLLLVSGVVVEVPVPAPGRRRAPGSQPALVLRAAHLAPTAPT